MNNKYQASGWPSDLLIFMIFRCSIFISFPYVFRRFWCFERVCRGGIVIPIGLLKAKSIVRIKHVQGVILDAREGPKPWNITCWNFASFSLLILDFTICCVIFWGSSSKIIEKRLAVYKSRFAIVGQDSHDLPFVFFVIGTCKYQWFFCLWRRLLWFLLVFIWFYIALTIWIHRVIAQVNVNDFKR